MRFIRRERPPLNEKDWAFLGQLMGKNGKWTVEIYEGHIVALWSPGEPIAVAEDENEDAESGD